MNRKQKTTFILVFGCIVGVIATKLDFYSQQKTNNITYNLDFFADSLTSSNNRYLLGYCYGINGDNSYGSNEPKIVYPLGINYYRCPIQTDEKWKIKQMDAACLHVIDYFHTNEGHLLSYFLPHKGVRPGIYPFYDETSYKEYLAYIKTMTERYNGITKFVPTVGTSTDSISFCIKDIALWNEPDLPIFIGYNEDGSPKLIGGDGKYYGLTIEQTYELIKPCVETIRSVHPTARIHTPAFAFFKTPQSYAERLFDYEWYDYDEKGNIIKTYTIEDFCDVVEFHYYNGDNDAIEVLERINALKEIVYKAAKKHNKWNIYNNPIWISETGTNNNIPDEERQARHTQKVYLYALSAGVENVSYWGAFEDDKKAWVDKSYNSISRQTVYSNRQIWKAMEALFSRLNYGCTIPEIQIKDDVCIVNWETANKVSMVAIWSLVDEIHIAINSNGDSIWFNYLGDQINIDPSDIKLTKTLCFAENIKIANYCILDKRQ